MSRPRRKNARSPQLSATQKAVLVEIWRRANAKAKAKAFSDDCLIAPQRRFVSDQAAQWLLVLASRRAGKTFAIAWLLIHTAQLFPDSRNLYITISQKVGKGLIWKTLRKMLDTYGIPHQVRLGDLQFVLPNGSTIEIHGVKNGVDVENLRGITGLGVAVVDEAQSIGPHLLTLEREVLAPALIDNPKSRAAICGTPPARKSNTFAKMIEAALNGRSYSLHRWTFAENHHLLAGRDPEEIIAAEAARRGVAIDDPSIEREYRGRLVQDDNALIVPLGAQNYFTTPPRHTRAVIGIDLGWSDSTAVFVWTYDDVTPTLWQAYEFSATNLILTKEAAREGQDSLESILEAAIARFKPTFIVADQGGGSRQGVETLVATLKRRLKIHIEAAEKTAKEQYVALMADAARRGVLKVRVDSTLAAELDGLEWGYDKDGRRVFPSAERKTSGLGTTVHRDLFHAAYYAFRKVEHVWGRALGKPQLDATPDAEAEEAAEMRRHAAAVKKTQTDPWGRGSQISYSDPLGVSSGFGF
jgi:hypothetical protein